MRRFTAAIFILAIPVAGCQSSSSGPTVAATPVTGSTADIADFQGARAGQAELGLNNRGYEPARTEGLTAYWWNDATQACARIVTSNGRYETVDTATPADCGK
ncbi:hypothetical protein GR183_00300 [Stappia sp. GBMRC 2046]|uniref:Uncharacterized protein n=1 Tax=Stappia sediminis TaxID=2692190 RepID=A0A7X3S5L0_9HYPH|nr:hypothetical protein [Stappia sediminis]MXN63329.1 hypothetical protein [Stappia sediminis]